MVNKVHVIKKSKVKSILLFLIDEENHQHYSYVHLVFI